MQRHMKHYLVTTAIAFSAMITHAQSTGASPPSPVQPGAPVTTSAPSVAAPTAAVPEKVNLPSLKDDPKFWSDRVKTRAQQRWALIVEKKFLDSYDFLTAASKSFVASAQYSANLERTNYTEGTVSDVVCEAEACRVDIRGFVDLRVPRIPKAVRTPVFFVERWVVEDGEPRLLSR